MLHQVRATSHLNMRLTMMRATVNEDSSHLNKILLPSITQIYLHTAETLPHRWMPSCNMFQLCETFKNFQKRP